MLCIDYQVPNIHNKMLYCIVVHYTSFYYLSMHINHIAKDLEKKRMRKRKKYFIKNVKFYNKKILVIVSWLSFKEEKDQRNWRGESWKNRKILRVCQLCFLSFWWGIHHVISIQHDLLTNYVSWILFLWWIPTNISFT